MILMFKSCFILVTLIFSLVASAKSYTIYAENGAGPWGQADGTGCGNEIVVAAYKAVGVEVLLKVAPYVRAKHMVMDGSALACFGMAWSDELKGKVIFPKTPIYTNSPAILTTIKNFKKYSNREQLPPHTPVGIVKGYEYPPSFHQLVNNDSFDPVEAESEVKNIQKVSAERLPLMVATIDDLKSSDYLVAEAGVENNIKTAFVLENSGTYLGFAIGNPDTPTAIKEFDNGMAIIKKDGTLQKILERWKAKLRAPNKRAQ